MCNNTSNAQQERCRSLSPINRRKVVSSLVVARGPTPDVDQLRDGAQERFPCLGLISLCRCWGLWKSWICAKKWFDWCEVIDFFRLFLERIETTNQWFCGLYGTVFLRDFSEPKGVGFCWPRLDFHLAEITQERSSGFTSSARKKRVLLKVWTWEIQVLPSFTSVDIVTMWIEAPLQASAHTPAGSLVVVEAWKKSSSCWGTETYWKVHHGTSWWRKLRMSCCLLFVAF